MPGRKTVMICLGTSGLSAGAQLVYEAFVKEIDCIDEDILIKTTGDRGIFRDTLVDVLEPGKDRITYEWITPDRVPRIVKEHICDGIPVSEYTVGERYHRFFDGQERIVLGNCGEIDPGSTEDYVSSGGYKGLEKVLCGMSPDEVIAEIKKSGIRGRGGAGFPTGVKWGFAARSRSDDRYVICNADEGDPGAFMDRSILEGDPLSVIEGMTMAGFAIGASRGFIYVRAEYPVAIERLTRGIKIAYENGYLGMNIMNSDFSFDIAIREGAGAFVCGEETALIRSIEGSRGMPAPRPPYPANRGLFGKPTVINNVETLANIPRIVVRGADWYASKGIEKCTGTKVFALAGKVKNTGLVEVPMGTTIQDVIFGPGGGMRSRRLPFKAVQMGGPSGGCLPEHSLDTPIDYESITGTGAIMGSGGMIVMDASTCMVDMARFFLEFTVNESCGKCPPCREGLKKMLSILDRIVAGSGNLSDMDELERLALLIKNTALCGLGNTAPNPVLTTLRYFRDEYVAHIAEKRCEAHVCTAMIHFNVTDRCARCGKCVRACPVNAIEWEKGSAARIDREKCIECRSCIEACEFQAIE